MIKPVPVMTATLALLLSSVAGAQTTVYETRDAEGNVSFSDESSPGSEAVDIQRTSVADAPTPLPEDTEAPREPDEGPAEAVGESGGTETIYDNRDDDYLYDDPRLRREEIRRREEPGTTDVESVRQDERRGAAGYDEANDGNTMEQADRAAERSDITGPDAEYRDTGRPEERPAHEGGMRR